MSYNFKITKHRDGGNLHLTLSGDFNNSAAQKLLQILNEGHGGVYQIIVDTNCLDSIHYTDKTIFSDFLDEISRQPFTIVFTGKYSGQII